MSSLPFNSYLQPMEKSNGTLSKGEFNLNGVLFYYELKLTRADDVLSNTNHNLFFNDRNGHVYLGYIKRLPAIMMILKKKFAR